MNLRKLYYSFPVSLRLIVRKLYFMPADFSDWIKGKRHPMVPPRGMIFTGPGDYLKTGNNFLKYFIELAALAPEQKVLDVGSGIGRMAVPLTGYLTTGEYEGFDIMKEGIDWCNKHITVRHPNFRFKHVALQNDLYSMDGNTANDFRFPYPDDHFDFVFLTSVFTHMLPDEVENYFREIRRVLKKRGRCLATFFILNIESKKYLEHNSAFTFPHIFGHYRLMDVKVKSANVAYEEQYIIEHLAKENGIMINAIKYGRWCGRPKDYAFDFQDIVVMEKIC